MAQSGTSVKNAYGLIDELLISKGWKMKFKMIYIAYYQNFYLGSIKNPLLWIMGPQIAEMPLDKRIKFDTRCNALALIFGPLYYIAKGMPLKGILLLALAAALFVYGHDTRYFIPLIFVYCGFSADLDYFCTKFLKSPDIASNPSLLTDYYDKFYIAKIVNRSPAIPAAKMLLMALVFIWSISFSFHFYNSKQNMRYFNSIEQVCSSTNACESYAKDLDSKINSSKDAARDYYKIGCAYYLAGQKKRALEYFSKSKIENPNNIKPYAASALVYSELNSYKSTIQNYEAILKIDPSIIYTYYYIGRTYYKKGEYKKALECFEKVTKQYPNEPVYLEAQAYTRIYLKDKYGARKDIEKTIKLLEKDKTKNAIKIENLKKYAQAMR